MIVYLGRREMTQSDRDFELGRQGEEGPPGGEGVSSGGAELLSEPCL